MKIYGIAKKYSKTYGHGDCGEEWVIPQFDAYHERGHFKPFFTTREAAEKLIETIKWNAGLIVVELNLHE